MNASELPENCAIALVSANSFVGRIPSSLAKCSSLEVLNLSDNGLTGDFPEAIVS